MFAPDLPHGGDAPLLDNPKNPGDLTASGTIASTAMKRSGTREVAGDRSLLSHRQHHQSRVGEANRKASLHAGTRPAGGRRRRTLVGAVSGLAWLGSTFRHMATYGRSHSPLPPPSHIHVAAPAPTSRRPAPAPHPSPRWLRFFSAYATACGDNRAVFERFPDFGFRVALHSEMR